MTTTPSPPDWRGLCEELLDEVLARPLIPDRALIDRARAALAQPEPEVVGPSLREVSNWITKCGQNPEENRWTRRVDHHDALAIAKAALYDWGRPAPAADGEVAGAAHVRRMCDIILNNTFGNKELDSLALLVGRHPDVLNASPAPAGEVGELVAWLRVYAREDDWPEYGHEDDWLGDAAQLTRIADLLEQRQAAPVPVAVSERPWERDGWCDEQGQCWMGDPGGGGFIPSWRLCRPDDAPRMRVSLPFNALPLPSSSSTHYESD